MKNSKMIAVFASIIFATSLIYLAHAQTTPATPDILAGRNLSLGASGSDVVQLQALLSELGYLNVPQGTTLGYYGPLTKNAVARYQSSLHVAPTSGYYGPLTKVAMYSDLDMHGYLDLVGWRD